MSENFVGFVTSRDIMKATGITNVATLVRWHSVEKLIPPPEIRRHPGGRGNMAYWPQWVLPYCQHIIQLKKSGKLLAEIRETLGQNWEQAAENYGRVAKQYKFSRESKRMAKVEAMFALDTALCNALNRWQNRSNTNFLPHTNSLINQEIVDRAVAMIEEGAK